MPGFATLSRPRPGVVIVRMRRTWALARVALVLCFAAVCAWLALADGEAAHFDLLVLALPLVTVPELLASLRIVFAGERLVFDAEAGVIERNARPLARVADVERFEITAVNSTCEELCLAAVCRDGRRIEIHTDGNGRRLERLANDLASALQVPLRRRA